VTPLNFPVPAVMIVLSRATNGGPNPPLHRLSVDSSEQHTCPFPVAFNVLPSSYVVTRLSINGAQTPVELPFSSCAPLGVKENQTIGVPLIVHLLMLAK
jgi:hypothetical protein